ncbi:MAG: mandelate racemase/muconate lactonizing enzyme family protein, partial [Myxococcales bacterium]|nr:mandelate racemase/muconate lactonizing enzyme family protein [Myxococcales bacterium]
MKITEIDLWHVAIPLTHTFYPSWIPGFPQSENRFTLVRLRTASGLEGWSAGAALGREREGLGALLGPYLLGERADDIPSIRQRLREIGYLGQRMGWLEPACWDIIGKARRKPVYELLGGERGEPIKLYASTGEVKTGWQRVEELEKRRAEGFETAKLRVHDATIEDDLAQIRHVAAALGGRMQLGIDANQGWRVAVVKDAPRWDYQRALAFSLEAQALGYSWVEEPLPMDDYASLAKLRQATSIDICGGELNSQGLPEFRTMLERGCYDIYQPDACFTGGIAETWQIIRLVEAAG